MKWFKARRTREYKRSLIVTALLGVAFVILQFIGFRQVQQGGVQLFGAGSNPAASFLGVIVGLHLLHIAGGVVALIIILMKSYQTTVKNYSSTAIEMAATYWHFVDVLWIYLFIFLMWL
jgi:cytochrome c oxidase subunit III